ncbi:hypothetical protein PM082_011811 [Marasmius tenuissimus]|nr:hypothetical protein PM082_011811 [Marasmius tenuissimus]
METHEIGDEPETERNIEARRRRNLLLSISTIPVEILGLVFSILINQDLNEPWSRGCGRWGWITIMHVCHRWRSVAYSTPSILSTPDFRYPRLAREMLLCSSQGPLKLVRKSWGPRNTRGMPSHPSSVETQALSDALQHISRVETLDLSLPNEIVLKILHNVTQPASILRHLFIHTWYPRLMSLPPNLFGGGAPVLREVRLKGCYLPWDSGILKDLVSLDLFYRWVERPPSTVEQIATVLKKMPDLEEFATAPMPSYNHIDQEASRYYTALTSSVAQTRRQCGRAPTRGIRTLFLSFGDFAGDEFLQILAWNQEVSTESVPGLSRVIFEDDDTLETLETECIIGNRAKLPLPHTYLWAEDRTEIAAIVLLSESLSALPLTSLSILHLHAADLAPTETIHRYFGSLPGLRTLFISTQTSPPDLLGALIDGDGRTHFPALDTLILQGVEFPWMAVDELDSSPAPRRRDVGSLIYCLERRASQGIPIRRLVLEGCSDLGPADITRISAQHVDLHVC